MIQAANAIASAAATERRVSVRKTHRVSDVDTTGGGDTVRREFVKKITKP
jgi:hypothetical protein